jgi:hypothetical protein
MLCWIDVKKYWTVFCGHIIHTKTIFMIIWWDADITTSRDFTLDGNELSKQWDLSRDFWVLITTCLVVFLWIPFPEYESTDHSMNAFIGTFDWVFRCNSLSLSLSPHNSHTFYSQFLRKNYLFLRNSFSYYRIFCVHSIRLSSIHLCIIYTHFWINVSIHHNKFEYKILVSKTSPLKMCLLI